MNLNVVPTGALLARRLALTAVRALPTRKRLCVSDSPLMPVRGRRDAGHLSPGSRAALPSASVEVTLTVNVPALAYVCWTAAPTAEVPSPKLHVVANALHTSNGETLNATGAPTVALAGWAVDAGPASKPRTCMSAGGVSFT